MSLSTEGKLEGAMKMRRDAGLVLSTLLLAAMGLFQGLWAATPSLPTAALDTTGQEGPAWRLSSPGLPPSDGLHFRIDPGTLPPDLPLPALKVREANGQDYTLEMAQDSRARFEPVLLQDGSGTLPLALPDVASLRKVRFRVRSQGTAALILEPVTPLLLTPSLRGGRRILTVTNWGPASSVEVRVQDAAGRDINVEVGGHHQVSGVEWRSLGDLQPTSRMEFRLASDPAPVYPVSIEARTDQGTAAKTTLYAPESGSGVCATPGKDGAGGTLGGIVNTYYPVTASVPAGATSVSVGASSGSSTAIAPGDLLLLIQMQDAAINTTYNSASYGDGSTGAGYSSLNGTGKFEFLKATGPVSGGSVPVLGTGSVGGTLNAYTISASTATKGRSSAQLVRVPQYSSATLGSSLTAAAWNGGVGGVLAIDVSGQLSLGGTVSVDGLGFRGGIQQNLAGASNITNSWYATGSTTTCFAMKGEGVAGTPRQMTNANAGTNLDGYPSSRSGNRGDYARGAPGNAGGGGNDSNPSANDQNAGGGGGGNGGKGGSGGHSWSADGDLGGLGGAIVPDAANLLILGGGGGAGARNNMPGGDGGGGAGGGIVLVRALTVTGVGTITANGGDSPGVLNPSLSDAAGGGGAGGTVLVYALGGNLGGLTVQAKGGRGGDAWPARSGATYPGDRHGPGGGGGGGAVLLAGVPASVNVSGGATGITTTANDAYGALPGNAGALTTSILGTQIPGIDAGGECSSSGTYIWKSSSAGTGYVSPGQTISYTITVRNTTASDWTNVNVSDYLPANTSYVSGTLTTSAPTTDTYADSFPSVGYTGSTGTIATWNATPWVEVGDDGSASGGSIRVVADGSGTTDSIRLRNTTAAWLYRPADLLNGGTGGWTSAKISFTYRRSGMTGADRVYLQVSPNGDTSTWTSPTTLYTIAGSTTGGVTDTNYWTVAGLDITPYMSSTFGLRFYPGTTFSNTLYIDNVVITLSKPSTASITPPTLASGLTLNRGDSLTFTYQVTVDPNAGPGVTAIANTATVTADGGINQFATVSNPLLPAPSIAPPILSADTIIRGSSIVAGGTVTVFKNGVSIGTATVQGDGTWNVPVSGLVAGNVITANVANGGATSGFSAPVVVSANAADVTPAPMVSSPIDAGATSVTGISTSPPGTIIDVYVDDSFVGQTAVQADHSWSLGGIGALTDGQKITATATDSANNHGTSAPSAPVYVSANAGDQTPAPTVLGPIYNGATTVIGTSTSPAGTLIDVFVNGVFLGQTTVQTGGAWSLSGIGSLANLDSVTATATDLANNHGTSAPSAPVIVEPSGSGNVTPAPSVDSPISAGATSVSGTSPSPDGTRIDVYAGLTFVGWTTVSGGTWSLSGISALTDGQVVTATATDSAHSLATSSPSAPVTVSGASGTTPAPSVTGPIYAGAASVTGTSTSPNTTGIDVYVNGVFLGHTTVTSGGWTLGGLSPLVAGTVITATATETGKGTSAPSSGVTVLAALPALLRVKWATLTGSGALVPPVQATVFPNAPSDPALPTSSPEVTSFASGTYFPDETTDATDTTVQVVYYQLEGNAGSTLRVTKSGGNVVITY